MVHDKTLRMIESLAAKSEESKLPWQPTPDESVFKVSLGDYAVTVFSRWNADQQNRDYFVAIYDSAGRVIEELSDLDLTEQKDPQEAYLMMKNLYENARRKAMGVSKAVDDILGQLAMNE